MDAHTHSSRVPLRDGEDEGVICLQQEIQQFAALSGCSPSYCPNSREPLNKLRGSTGKAVLFARWKRNLKLILTRNVGLKRGKYM